MARIQSNDEKLHINYERWWENEGKYVEQGKHETTKDFLHRITRTAWLNGAYIQTVLLEEPE